MPITKIEIAELVREIKGGGDASSEAKFHPTIIYKVAEMARNHLIKTAYNESRSYSSQQGYGVGRTYINGDFYSTYKNVPIKEDCETNRVYSLLPGRLISLPHDRGLRSVSPMQEEENQFNIVEAGSSAVYAGLEADVMSGPEIYIEGDRIYYRNLTNTDCKVLIRMVSSINDLKEDEIIPIPADYELQFLELIKASLEEQKIAQQDKHNDANINTVG
tara:strand:+ start:9414 stop:10067 length:654 start_codon:yes stop_codon:yes gene_type:complete